MTFSERVFNTGIVPVVVLNKVEDAVPLANALLKGGIDFMEITFRTECAAECMCAPDGLYGFVFLRNRAVAMAEAHASRADG